MTTNETKPQKLTLEMVKDKMSAIDCIKHFRPDYDDETCDYLVWNETCYPMSIEEFIKQVNERFYKE